MKKETKGEILLILLLIVSLTLVPVLYFNTSRSGGYKILEQRVKYEIDSVEYHPIGSDNTLQTTPYWKLHLKGTDIRISSYRMQEPGDSIEIIEKTIIKK